MERQIVINKVLDKYLYPDVIGIIWDFLLPNEDKIKEQKKTINDVLNELFKTDVFDIYRRIILAKNSYDELVKSDISLSFNTLHFVCIRMYPKPNISKDSYYYKKKKKGCHRCKTLTSIYRNETDAILEFSHKKNCPIYEVYEPHLLDNDTTRMVMRWKYR